jgi:flavin-binding protein dodecin
MGRLSASGCLDALFAQSLLLQAWWRFALPGAYDGLPEAFGTGSVPLQPAGARQMAKKQVESGVYRVTEIIGTSPVSWEDAAKSAVETAAKSLRDLRIAEVSKLDMKIEGGKVVAYRARVSLSFKYDA